MLCDCQALLKVMCSSRQIVFCGWKSLHLWSTHINFTSLHYGSWSWCSNIFFSDTLLILSRTRTTWPPYSCPSNSRSSSRLPRENTTVKKDSQNKIRENIFFNSIQLVRTQLWINILRTKFKKNFSNLNKLVRTQLWISILRTKFKKIFSYLNKLVRAQMWKKYF